MPAGFPSPQTAQIGEISRFHSLTRISQFSMSVNAVYNSRSAASDEAGPFPLAIAASRTPIWLPSAGGCRGRRLSRARGKFCKRQERGRGRHRHPRPSKFLPATHSRAPLPAAPWLPRPAVPHNTVVIENLLKLSGGSSALSTGQIGLSALVYGI